MTDAYDPSKIEGPWQEKWEADGLYHAPDDDPRPKWYFLTMLPYTSGDLHIGHWYAMGPSDVAARGHHQRARVLSLDAVVVPQVLREGPGLSRQGARQLVPFLPDGARQRAGAPLRRLRALRHGRHPSRPGAVVLPHHPLRR